MFDAITTQTRKPHWYVEGEIPDTIDGRFAVLATLTALALVRLESGGDDGNAASVALTERFIEVMESEHRELGLGDPTLGKRVRKLVGSLSRRVELWREATNGEREWNEAVQESLYGGDAKPDAVTHSAHALQTYWSRLREGDVAGLMEGKIG